MTDAARRGIPGLARELIWNDEPGETVRAIPPQFTDALSASLSRGPEQMTREMNLVVDLD